MSDPQLMGRYSDDDGRNWSAEQWFSLGPAGDYHRRFVLDQQGSAITRLYEWTFTDDRSITFLAMHADIHFGT